MNNELFCISKLNSSFLKIPYSTSFLSFCNLLRTYAFWIDSFKALPSWFDVFQVQIDCRGEKRTSFGGEFSVNWIIISRQRHFKLGNHFPTLGTRGFLACGGNFRCLAEGRHIFGRRPKPRAAKPREKPLARSGAFYRSRWPLCFFIGLHLRQSDWKSPTVIMWAGTWRSVQRPTLSLAKQIRV